MAAHLNRTPLYDTHLALGAKMGEYAGWSMPLWYSGALREHHAVRHNAGLFDVSHLSKFEIAGDDALSFIQRITTNDAGRLAINQCQYTLLCRDDGGIIDDALLYRLPDRFLLVGNAANAERTFHWLLLHLTSPVTVVNATHQLALLAVQGPQSECRLNLLVEASLADLPHCGIRAATVIDRRVLIVRGGYTGEDGFELFCASSDAPSLWTGLLAGGSRDSFIPCGLAARDSLRLEAGLRLYGQDIDESTNPVEVGLTGVVSRAKRDFVGRAAILGVLGRGVERQLVGLMAEPRTAIPRPGDSIRFGSATVGIVTSGGFSPTFGRALALGYLPSSLSMVGTLVNIIVYGRSLEARVTRLPFYRQPRRGANSGT